MQLGSRGLVGIAVVAATLVAATTAAAGTGTYGAGSPYAPRQTSLRPADRAAINRLLDRFVPAAVARRDPAAAYHLVTPRLREGSTPRDWARGDVPALPYHPRGATFHHWRRLYSFPNEIDVELILQPGRGETMGPIAFDVNFKRVGGRLLIDAFDVAATFAPHGKPARMFSAADVGPGVGGSDGSSPTKARLGARWVAVPLSLLALPLVAALVWGVREVRWRRRARAAERAHPPRRELQPLLRRSSIR
jgi:hypothetical protein